MRCSLKEILDSGIMNELFDVSEQVIVVTGATGILAGGAAKYLQKTWSYSCLPWQKSREWTTL